MKQRVLNALEETPIIAAAKEGAGWHNEMTSKEETPNDRCQ